MYLFHGKDNFLTAFNTKLHSSALYNGVQFTASALAVFSGAAYKTMKPMPRTCFVADAMILTASGVIAIENIKAGDKVISTNEDTFETLEKTVVETYIREVPQLVHLTINGELISTTIDHPFYVKNQGFVSAGKLRLGDGVVDSKGNIYLLEKVVVEFVKEPKTVYNFQVEDFHTYHAGNTGILVHNAKYDIGKYDEMPNEAGLDKHHVPQKAAMKKLDPNYDPAKGPSIKVPKVGHTIKGKNGIVSRSMKGINSLKDLMVRDISELRRVYPDIPESVLEELKKLTIK